VIGAEIGFEALFNERLPIYIDLTDVTIQCKDKSPEDITIEIIEQINSS
jgi:shikimate kinase